MILSKNTMVKFGPQIIGILMEFLHLGRAVPTLLKFDKSKHSELTINYPPSLSPKDPNFPVWWEEHKFEWEILAKTGQEPADDLIK